MELESGRGLEALRSRVPREISVKKPPQADFIHERRATWLPSRTDFVRLVGAVVIGVGFAGAAGAQESENDPLESLNRGVFQFNLALDGFVMEPAAKAYRWVFPDIVRTGVQNFFANLRAPIVLANDILQGEPDRAQLTLGRFMFNTIMGVGGLVDVGGLLGMPERHNEDFGQTLAAYGIGPGPYLMLPLLGPSNPRDTVGFFVDFVFDPLTFLASTEVNLARIGTEMLSFRERNIENIDEFKRSSIDLYASTRTLSRQLRDNEIRNGASPPLEDIYQEDIYDLEEDPEDVETE